MIHKDYYLKKDKKKDKKGMSSPSSQSSQLPLNELQCGLWTRQNIDQVGRLYPDNTFNLDKLFLTLFDEYQRERQQSQPAHQQSANFATYLALWFLVRIYNTENLAVRKCFVRALEHVEQIELLVNRALELNQRYPPVVARPHSPERAQVITSTFIQPPQQHQPSQSLQPQSQ